QPPSITAVSVSPATVAAGEQVTISATVSDPDSAGSLQVSAYALDTTGNVLASTPLTLEAGAFVGTLAMPASATVRVVASDSPGSNESVSATAGQVTVTS
ncbi:MAG: hypothetical protein HUU35_01765, partial [Armatimonadetes bacterium]|nr:hypothetical protein [Armatimonadota bacterium]